MTEIQRTTMAQYPPALRGSDPDSFAENTVKVRLKDICQRTMAENNYSDETNLKFKSLCEDIPYGRIRSLEDREAPDSEDWQVYTSPYLDQDWLEVPWFFAETYFYRRILEASGFFTQGRYQGLDPYVYQKRLGLEQFVPAIQQACTLSVHWIEKLRDNPHLRGALLGEALSLALWGNQADLSMWPAGETTRPEGDDEEPGKGTKNLVVDERQAVCEYLERSRSSRVDFVLDNAGVELVNDLLVADYLLTSKLAAEVVLHVKSHPTFVSDATTADVMETLAFISAIAGGSTRQSGKRLIDRFDSGEMILQTDIYWTSPLAMWDAPQRVLGVIQDTDLLIGKGDANYRRFVGDRHWAPDFPMAALMSYLPVPYLALRVCKSEVIAGLQSGQTAKLKKEDPTWMVNGRWGTIQFAQ